MRPRLWGLVWCAALVLVHHADSELHSEGGDLGSVELGDQAPNTYYDMLSNLLGENNKAARRGQLELRLQKQETTLKALQKEKNALLVRAGEAETKIASTGQVGAAQLKAKVVMLEEGIKMEGPKVKTPKKLKGKAKK